LVRVPHSRMMGRAPRSRMMVMISHTKFTDDSIKLYEY
jgi:hypothetical protein